MTLSKKKETDMELAKSELARGEATCVMVIDGKMRKSAKRGVAPLVEWMSKGMKTRHASVADKVVGKAPAMLYVSMGVDEVYARVMTTEAIKMMRDAGIEVYFDEEVERILNDRRDDICPMEKLVDDMADPVEALGAMRQILGM